ncbi:MAG TPA: tagaturonate reductase [Gemmatimonadaceae bacterium]
MSTRPRLSRELVASLALAERTGVELPPVETLELPEKIVQFGTGAFLRGFAEYFVDEANRLGMFGGSVVAISSTGSQRDELLNEQDGLYTLAIQGVEGSAARQRYRVIASLSRALSARDEWDAVLELARSPEIGIVISNSTEVGIVLDENDHFDTNPPRSFPGKLTRFLAERARAFDYDAERGIVVLPCELIDDNGDTLRAIVQELARRWKLGPRFERWLGDSVTFCNTLVDRIVPGVVSPAESERIGHLFEYRDGLLTACESYALFAIEGDDRLRARLCFTDADPRIIIASDIRPYRERKVRVLNGAHTISVPVALLAGLETVRDAVEDERVGRFIRRVVFDDIVPSLEAPGAEEFAAEVLERFANPYIRHALIDITLYGTTKMRVRVVPSIVDHFRRVGRPPTSLAFGFAAYLAFMRGDLQAERRTTGLVVPEDGEGDRIRDAWLDVDPHSDASLSLLARRVCADKTLWGADLSLLNGFADLVGEHLVRIIRQGIQPALDAHLTEHATT